MAPVQRSVADRTQGMQPLAGPRMPVANHDENVWPAGHEHIKDLRKGEQLAADLVDALAGARDLNPMGLHLVFSVRHDYYVL